MERPERPSRPEKPNTLRDTLRNSIRIRRRISNLLYEMGSQDSTDSDSEEINSVQSPSRRPVSRRHNDLRCAYGGGPSESQDTLRHHSSPPAPVALSPPSRNFLDVFRSEPSTSSLLYTLQPFRSPQRPLPVSVNHPLPMFHHHHHHPSSTSSSFDPLANSGSRNRDFNILVPSTASGGAMRDTHVERDRPSMSGTFYVCDDTPSLNPPKRFCPNSNCNMTFSSPRQPNNFTMLRDRSEPLPSTSSVVVGAEDLSMALSSLTRDTDRRLSHNDSLASFGAQNSGERGGNGNFITTLDSSRDDSLDGNGSEDDMNGDMNVDEAVTGAGGVGGSNTLPSTSTPHFFMGAMSGAMSGEWMNPTRVSSRGSSSNRVSLGGRNLASRPSFILRAVDELEEARLRNRGMIIDDEVLDEELVPSSRPASDSDGIDEDVRTAVTNLEFLRDGGNNSNDILSQVEADQDRVSSSSPDGEGDLEPQQETEGQEGEELAHAHDDHSQLVAHYEIDHHSDEEVVLISVSAAMPPGEENEELSDVNSATTEPPEELSNEPFDVAGASPSGTSVAPNQADQVGAFETDATCHKAADADEGQDFNAKLLALLECPVCLETIVPPIHQCKKGHPVCSVCRPRLTVCPTCRSRFTETRNLLMEKVADMMQFPCKNYVVGCSVSTGLKDKTSHELGCGYMQYSCIDRDCQWKGFKQELLVHCNKLHLDKVIISHASNYNTLIIPFELHRQSSWVMSALDEVFLVTFKVYPHNILRGCTVYLGPPENALNYNYYFKFGCKRHQTKSFKYREMTIPNKKSIHCNEFFQDTCFSYQFDPNNFKLVNGRTIIEGKIAVTKVMHRCAR